jgi:hypothetical protein
MTGGNILKAESLDAEVNMSTYRGKLEILIRYPEVVKYPDRLWNQPPPTKQWVSEPVARVET